MNFLRFTVLLAANILLLACGSPPRFRPVPKIPPIPMTDREYWRCGVRVPGGEYITVYFQGMVPQTKPQLTLWDGDEAQVTVYLDCTLIPLGKD